MLDSAGVLMLLERKQELERSRMMTMIRQMRVILAVIATTKVTKNRVHVNHANAKPRSVAKNKKFPDAKLPSRMELQTITQRLLVTLSVCWLENQTIRNFGFVTWPSIYPLQIFRLHVR